MATTYRKPKQFAWSYSKLKNYDNCPKRYYEVDVVKSVKEKENDNLKWGNLVHEALARRLLPDKVTLPVGMEQYEKPAAKIEKLPGTMFVEQRYALNEQFQPTEWFADDAWCRSVADVVIINGPKALAIDWKLGKVVEDIQQLALMALCIFAHFPDVQVVDTVFKWFKEEAESWEKFKREDIPKIWMNLMPRVQQLKHSHDTMQFPPKPNRFCRNYCPVATCEYHGK